MPEGETDETIRQQMEDLKELYQTSSVAIDPGQVREIMESTFPIRRQGVIEQNERVWKVVQD